MPADYKLFKILFVGGPDRADLTKELAARMGLHVQCACPVGEHTSLRDLARAIAESGAARGGGEDNALHQLLQQGDWDAIVLRQFAPSAGLSSTFNGDLDCLLDYFADFCPGAKVYWDMPWAFGENTTVFPGFFSTYYDSSQAVMFNCIARCVADHVLAGEFAHRLAGWVPTGAVIQHLRRVWGRELTTDGFHLDDQGQWAVALTALHTLFPELALDAVQPEGDTKQWKDVLDAVGHCCAQLTHAPEALDEPEPRTIEQEGKLGEFTALRAAAPNKLFFPDMVRLKDGTMLMGVYEHNCHAPHNGARTEHYAREGAGRILVLRGSADGKQWDYDHPLLVVDEVNMAKWGIVQTRGRYQRLQRGETDYCIISDPRDPNLGLVHADLTGDGEKDEVIVLTVWMCNYYPTFSDHQVFTIQSADGGLTWYPPQEMEREDGFIPLKRGDMAVFGNGEMLFPYYSLRRESSRVGVLHLRWDVQAKRWRRIGDYAIPNFAPWEGNSFNFNEVSLVIPDPSNEDVYGYVRESGSVMRSQDRGRTWQEVGVEPGLIHQPGFAPMDGRRVFSTWARTVIPRSIYGKLFFPKAGWSHTLTREMYASPNTAPHDMADPSCKQLADGRILVFCYDTTYRAIIGTIIDPEEERFQPVELQQSVPAGLLAQGDLSQRSIADPVELASRVPESCTACICAAFRPGGVLDVELSSAGLVTFRAGENGVPAEGICTLYYAAVGQLAWTKVEGQNTWTAVGSQPRRTTGLAVSGQGVEVGEWTLTRRMVIGLTGTLDSVEGGQDVLLEPTFNPQAQQVSWCSDRPDVASVSEDGLVTIHTAGRASITVTADGVETTCQVNVRPSCRELTQVGRVVFADDFTGYQPGENAFWQQMGDHGYVPGVNAGPNSRCAYSIVADQQQGSHLMLRSGVSNPNRFTIDTPLSGDFTLAFDFYFTHPRPGTSSILTSPEQIFYINVFGDTDIHGIVQLTPEGVRIQHRPQGTAGNVEWPGKFCWDIQYPLNCWHSAKIARIQDGICVKVWPKGEQEPDKWGYTLISPELHTDRPTRVALEYLVSIALGQNIALDNLTITQTE